MDYREMADEGLEKRFIAACKTAREKELRDAAELKAFRATGHTPEEFARLWDIFQEAYNDQAELMAYRKAKEEGRLVELPCKVGGSFYGRHGHRVVESVVTGYTINADGQILIKGSCHDAMTIREFARSPHYFLTHEAARAAMEKEGKG